ncbi:hypothetical protein ABK040_016582 [Willaertia magna]
MLKNLSPLVEKALQFATLKHVNQKRSNGDNYIVHPTRVMEQVSHFFSSSFNGLEQQNELKEQELINLQCAALLHDTLEDTETSVEELNTLFGEEITKIVIGLTSDNEKIKLLQNDLNLINKYPNLKYLKEGLNLEIDNLDNFVLQKRMAKSIYLTNKINEMDEFTKIVKLCDRLDNILDVNDLKLYKIENYKEKPKNKNFNIEYKWETRFILENLEKNKLNNIHLEIMKELQKILY